MGKVKENIISKNSVKAAIVFLIFGFLVIFVFTIIEPFNDWSFNVDPTLFSQYGDFIGGFVGTIFSFVAILLLYKTLIEQQKALVKQDKAIKIQKKSFEIETFESTFFNLLKTQQDLTTDIKAYINTLDRSFNNKTITVSGREFFAYAEPEMRKLWDSISSEKYLGMYENNTDYFQYINQKIEDLYNPSITEYIHPDAALIEENKIRHEVAITYINWQFGISEEFWKSKSELDVETKLKVVYGLFFQKYHYAIGHYFRHLYHIIRFVKEFTSSSKQSKKINSKYIGFIQAQMSSFELMLLFYNAISFPRLLKFMIEFNFLENLTEEDLLDKSHNCIEGIKLKSRKELLNH